MGNLLAPRWTYDESTRGLTVRWDRQYYDLWEQDGVDYPVEWFCHDVRVNNHDVTEHWSWRCFVERNRRIFVCMLYFILCMFVHFVLGGWGGGRIQEKVVPPRQVPGQPAGEQGGHRRQGGRQGQGQAQRHDDQLMAVPPPVDDV